MPLLRLSFLIAGLALYGCEQAWERVNGAGLESDVQALLEVATGAPQRVSCQLDGSSRAATCTLRLTTIDTAFLIRSLSLERLPPLNGPSNPVGMGCPVGGVGTATYGISGRPSSLKLSDGTSFEYLKLTVDEETGAACLRLAYAYG